MSGVHVVAVAMWVALRAAGESWVVGGCGTGREFAVARGWR